MATDVKARLTNTGFSAQKVRLVIDMVRGKSVADALNILKFSNRVCAEPLYKLIASAAANAEESFDTGMMSIPSTCFSEQNLILSASCFSFRSESHIIIP